MAYNKSKYIDSAQKYLSQGKISQAIGEYQQILRQEPRDQVTLMTVGDLYVRMGETFQALEYFDRLAQLFIGDGFLAKAIAIYKKIAKLAPEETKPLERLAELYVQQGVLSEARPLYLQLAEAHLKAKRYPQAVTLLRKLLEAEPDNLRVMSRLADLYQAMGQKKDAAEAFVRCAQRQLDRHDHAETEKFAAKALAIDPAHPGAIMLRARALVGAGKRADAASMLATMAESDTGAEASTLLLDLYLQSGEMNSAVELAQKILTRNPKNFAPMVKVISALLDKGPFDRALELIATIREPMIEAGDHEHLVQILTAAAAREPARLETLEWLVNLYDRTSDSFHLPDALAQLAQAAASAGQLERAKEVYDQLVERTPENEDAWKGLNKVRKGLGMEPAQRAAKAPLAGDTAPEVEAKPVPLATDAPLDEETQRFVVLALTDVDLFASYGMTRKAVNLLETILQRAPRHTVALEKLLDLSLGAGDDQRTAELAAQLEQIYAERGEPATSERFGDLHKRYERAVAEARPAEHPAPSPPVAAPTSARKPAPEAAQQAAPETAEFEVPAERAESVAEVDAVPAAEAAVHEVDLSDEWAALSQQVEEAMEHGPPPEKAGEAVARTPEEEEILIEEPAAEEQGTLVEKEAEEPAEAPAAKPVASADSADQFLSELSAQFDVLQANPAALTQGSPSAKAPAPPPARPGETVAPSQASAGTPQSPEPLREVFEEFRAALGELTAEDEDPETHYNLGIAYREMGLLEEAIGEFQKVAKSMDKNKAFRYAMQCCTLLGLAFMEKGQPAIAAMWYQRALDTPELDQESILALRYDLGVAQELAGNEQDALKSFSQVYAMNIDYRDVADRIATLAKRH